MKLLIVEDDLLLQEGLAQALDNVRYALDCASTAAQADALIQSGEYSLIILDLGLPDKDGATLLSQWRRRVSPRSYPGSTRCAGRPGQWSGFGCQ